MDGKQLFSPVHIWLRPPQWGVASINDIQNRVFEKARKTTKNAENQRKSLVFGLASIKTARYGGATRNRTGDKGFADLCLTAWLWRRFAEKPRYLVAFLWSGLRGSNPPPRPWQGRALPNELNPHTAFYNCGRWCLGSELNQRHKDFQSSALPTELPRQNRPVLLHRSLATRMGLEPTTSSVTG